MSRFIFLSLSIALLYLIKCQNLVYCKDGSECPALNTCCLTSRGYSCCPFENGVCCGDDFHCCSSGYICDLDRKFCVSSMESKPLTEMAPTSLIYKKGWNELYYNCKDDLNLIKDDLVQIINLFNNPSEYSQIKRYLLKLIEDGKIIGQDCLKFIIEVFG